jgi:hypothetical protein
MALYPRKLGDRLQFCQQHQPLWLSHADSIGVQAAEVTVFGKVTASAAAALDALLAARQALGVATTEYHAAMAVMDQKALGLIANITGYAKNNSAPAQVYADAALPMPAQPSPVPAPGTPQGARVQLQQTGALELRWDCKNPPNATGTVYEIHRQDGTTSTHLGTTGDKQFLDTTLPAGVPSVTYTITAVRSTMRGAPAQFTVNFGTPAGSTPAAGTPAVGTTPAAGATATIAPVRQAA